MWVINPIQSLLTDKKMSEPEVPDFVHKLAKILEYGRESNAEEHPFLGWVAALSKKRKAEGDGKEEKQVEKKQHVAEPPPPAYEEPPAPAPAPVPAPAVVVPPPPPVEAKDDDKVLYSGHFTLAYYEASDPDLAHFRTAYSVNLSTSLPDIGGTLVEGMKGALVRLHVLSAADFTKAGFDTETGFRARMDILSYLLTASKRLWSHNRVLMFFHHQEGKRVAFEPLAFELEPRAS